MPEGCGMSLRGDHLLPFHTMEGMSVEKGGGAGFDDRVVTHVEVGGLPPPSRSSNPGG